MVEQFLLGLGIAFDPEEIDQPDDEPPDARFREASFEVKEVQDRGRRRGDEYRQRLREARAAESAADLAEQFTPHDITMSDVCNRLLQETAFLAAKKYRSPAVRQSLDLLFYLNLSMETAWGIIDGSRPDLAAMKEEGWRSVSFVRGGDGASTCCVSVASDESPSFFKPCVDELFGRDSYLDLTHGCSR